MKAIRTYSAWESANARATGGGPATKQPDTDGILITGSLLSLKSRFGIGVTGMDGEDCDAGELPPPVFGRE